MARDSMTLIQFQDRFRTEADCLAALEKLRWPNGFICPNCGHDAGYRMHGRPLIQCAVCRYQASVTAGTIFHKTRIPLRHWFWMIYMVAQDKGGASAMRLANQLGMYYKTTWHVLHKIREAMSNQEESRKLAGLIELDEGYFGGTGRGVGRGKKHKTQVLVMVETKGDYAGRLCMKVADTIDRRAFTDLVEHNVLPNQHFKTDGLQSHWVLRSIGHTPFIRKVSGKESCNWLPWVHIVISNVKRFLLGTYHGVSKKHLQPYLDEFSFRFNRRFRQPSITSSLLSACLLSPPVTYAELRL
jgi:transposase-like protein